MKLFSRTKAANPADTGKRFLSGFSFRGRGRSAAPGENGFSSSECAIWQDITRALSAAPKSRNGSK